MSRSEAAHEPERPSATLKLFDATVALDLLGQAA